jgi:hypothetical protein
MTCSLLVALRGCRRGRWHDGGREGKEREGKDGGKRRKRQQRLSKHPRTIAEIAKQHRAIKTT